MKVDINSWHYRLIASTIGFRSSLDVPSDSCKYISKVIKILVMSTIAASLVAAASLSALMMVGSWIGWLEAMLLTWSYIPPVEEALAVNALLGIALFIAAVAWLSVTSRRLTRPTNPGFVSQAWERTHHKFCSPIEITDNKLTGE